MLSRRRRVFVFLTTTQLLLSAACGDNASAKKTGDAGAPDGGGSSRSDAGMNAVGDGGSAGDGDGDTAGDGDTSGDGDGDTSGDGDGAPGPTGPQDLSQACTQKSDCEDICISESEIGFPGGVCSKDCSRDEDCGSKGKCVEFSNREYSACLVSCQTRANCRDRYVCQHDPADASWAICVPGSRVGGYAFVGAGLTVEIKDDVGGSLKLTASGEFELPNIFEKGQNYSLTASIAGSPAGQVCSVLNGAGPIDYNTALYRAPYVVCGKQAVFTAPGTTQWTVPAGVTSVSVVAVGPGGLAMGPYGGGGGQLCYANDMTVTPGAKIAVVVGNFAAGTNDSSFFGKLVASGGGNRNDNEASGGSQGYGGTCFSGGQGGVNGAAGGAGGYSGPGGRGNGYAAVTNGSGGGGGGGVGGSSTRGAGGGVGLEGKGADGVQPGGNGSQANPWVPVAGGGSTNYDGYLNGQHGGVRIIWGEGRSYPDNAANQ
ncbi:MAG: hypothetical protein QM778_07375 [Myxococcales bacterium]